MTLAWYLGTALPFSTHLFTPTTQVEQVQNTPILILAALQFSLALAYLALWRAAPDYRNRPHKAAWRRCLGHQSSDCIVPFEADNDDLPSKTVAETSQGWVRRGGPRTISGL